MEGPVVFPEGKAVVLVVLADYMGVVVALVVDQEVGLAEEHWLVEVGLAEEHNPALRRHHLHHLQPRQY